MKDVRHLSAEVQQALNLVVDALGDDLELLTRIVKQTTYDRREQRALTEYAVAMQRWNLHRDEIIERMIREAREQQRLKFSQHNRR